MRVAIIGMGKTGLPMAVGLLSKGHEVWGVDVSSDRLADIGDAKWVPTDPGCEYEWRRQIHLTTDLEKAIGATELGILIVNTPEDSPGVMDLVQVEGATEQIASALNGKKYTLLVSSTVMPGTCRDIIAPRVGPTCTVVSNPVWIALGSVIKDYMNPPVLLYGCPGKPTEALKAYIEETYDKTPMFTDQTTAEAIKIVYNVWCTTKMAFINYAAHTLTGVGGDPSVLEPFMKAGGERVGMFLKPGAPFGGPCFPRDLRFARTVAEGDWTGDFVKALEGVNQGTKWDIVDQIPTSAKTVGVVGLSYKVGVPVTEESPSLDVIEDLINLGYEVETYDALISGTCEALEECIEEVDVLIEMHPGSIPNKRYKTPIIRPWGPSKEVESE
jgi:nucleotide sugar dehydrogenase